MDPTTAMRRFDVIDWETKKPLGKKKAKMHPIRTPITTAVTILDLRRDWGLFRIKGPSLSLRPIIVATTTSKTEIEMVVLLFFWLWGFEEQRFRKWFWLSYKIIKYSWYQIASWKRIQCQIVFFDWIKIPFPLFFWLN